MSESESSSYTELINQYRLQLDYKISILPQIQKTDSVYPARSTAEHLIWLRMLETDFPFTPPFAKFTQGQIVQTHLPWMRLDALKVVKTMPSLPSNLNLLNNYLKAYGLEHYYSRELDQLENRYNQSDSLVQMWNELDEVNPLFNPLNRIKNQLDLITLADLPDLFNHIDQVYNELHNKVGLHGDPRLSNILYSLHRPSDFSKIQIELALIDFTHGVIHPDSGFAMTTTTTDASINPKNYSIGEEKEKIDRLKKELSDSAR